MDENSLILKARDKHERYNNLQQQVIEKTTKRSENSSLRQKYTPNIMIVDDEEDILLSFKTFLEDNNSLINVKAETFEFSGCSPTLCRISLWPGDNRREITRY